MLNAPVGCVSETTLEQVISTEELQRRPARAPDHAAENAALVRLARVMAQSPQELLQALTDEAQVLCRAGSAGISVIEADRDDRLFRWHAVSGALSTHLWRMTLRNFSPCGTAVDRNAVVLMRRLERHFRYFADIRPEIVEALLIPFTIDGETVGTVWVAMHDESRGFDLEDERLLRDLAEFAAAGQNVRLAIEAGREGDRRKEELLAIVARELRNPLSAAQTASRCVQRRLRALNEPQIQAMNESGQRHLKSMGRTIDELMDIARIRLDKIELRKEVTAVGGIIQQAADSCRARIDASHHDLRVLIPDAPLWVEADRWRLTQIVANVIDNAAKYTREGGQIDVTVARDDDEIAIRVRDNGIGIAKFMLPRVFDLCAQDGLAREHARGGLGMGLAVVRRLVELHGGRVAVRSEGLDQGSEFVINLPLAAEAYPLEILEDGGSPDPAPARSLHIRVDDDSEAEQSLALFMSSSAHDVRTAYDGARVLTGAQSFSPE